MSGLVFPGWYADGRGRKWLCVYRKANECVVCDCEDGTFTAASLRVFANWNWSPVP
jgi:hypothetical protein